MVEFAAGIMLGGSIGAVIMGALVGQARDSVARRVDSRSARTEGRITHRPVELAAGDRTLFVTRAAAVALAHHQRLH
ncbi:MAG: hypothetical protein ACREQL_05195 [Candidatus Binatia bacterium]